jgi:hypothetical protein
VFPSQVSRQIVKSKFGVLSIHFLGVYVKEEMFLFPCVVCCCVF